MPTMRPPRDPQPTEDVKGPNHPSTVDPGFDNPYRDKAGDTVGAGDFAGRKKPERGSWPW